MYRKDHLHRIVYIFEYSKPHKDFEIQEVFNTMISEVNSGYYDEPITGMLIYYGRLGINMVEGSEYTLIKHLQDVHDSGLLDTALGRIKILLVLTHIKQRFFSRWLHLMAQPQTLLDRIDPFAKKDEVYKQLKMLIEMLYRSWNYLRIKTMGLTKPVINVKDLLTERLIACLPETMRLEFALATPVLRDFTAYVTSLLVVKDTVLYHELVWPLPSIYVKYDLMKKTQEDREQSNPTDQLDILNQMTKRSIHGANVFY